MTTTSAAASRRWAPHLTVVSLCFAAAFISYIDRTNISVAAIAMKEQFGWTETVKGFVLSSFFIGYIVLQVASGTLANRFGGKIVLGIAVVWWSIFTMLTPPAAAVSLGALVATRIALGLGEAAVFPASINMVGRWVPPAARTRAVATISTGLSLGTLVALPLTGWLVKEYGWPLPFYAFGAVGLVWALFWFTQVAPGRAIDPVQSDPGRRIPWGTLLRLPAVWAIVINHFCHNWTLYLLLAWLPSYFKATFGVTLASAGLLSAAPWLVSFLSGNLAGVLGDALLQRGKSPTFVRKLMQSIGLFGGAVFLLLVRDAGSVTTALLLMCATTAALAFCMAGFAPNSFDVAPRYADVIWGISNTAASIPGIIGVAATGWLVDRTGSYATPFLVTGAFAALGGIVFLLFGSGRRLID
jgi:ACS family sodium-dependent inorganic phosphate cotransporter